jgi:molecular chaperone DnaJ
VGQPRDYYDVLGVPRTADARAIKDAFRGLALKHHPDRNKAPDAGERFREIAEAYAVLSDPKRRAAYDASGFASVEGLSPDDLFGGMDLKDIFGGLGFDFPGLGRGGLFERIFGRRAGPVQGENIEVVLSIPLERVAHGGEEIIRVQRLVSCEACKGAGARAGTTPRKCEVCGGSGQRVVSEQRGAIRFQHVSPCPACQGRGLFIDQPCPECKGAGKVSREDVLSVHIPVGVEEGAVLRLRGRGLSGSGPGTSPGDLLVIVRTAPDARFERRGRDLYTRKTISVADAALGTGIQCPTLEGFETLKAPPGTQPGAILRLPGKGLPRFGGGSPGDVYVLLQVRVPERLTNEQRKLFERLRKLEKTSSGEP